MSEPLFFFFSVRGLPVAVCAAQVWSSVVIGPAQTHFLVWESWKVELWDIKDV